MTDYGLSPNRAYFTVLYGNMNCDPAQAFVFGPFYTNSLGQYIGNFKPVKDTTRIPGGVVAATGGQNGKPLGSISTRIGDTDAAGNPTDQDGDGRTGPAHALAPFGHAETRCRWFAPQTSLLPPPSLPARA